MPVAVQLVFLHGLESGPHGSKFHLLQSLGLGEVLAPDCHGVQDVARRLAMIEAALGDTPQLLLVGSSFGGLMALVFAAAHPQQIAGLVLCAPAVHRPELVDLPGSPGGGELPAVPVRVRHGSQDTVVPLAPVRAFCQAQGLPLQVIDDGHRLAESHAELAALVREVWQLCRTPGNG